MPTKSPPPTFTRVLVEPTRTPTATPEARPGGELVQALDRDAVSLHPYLTTDPISALYQANLYARGLWTPDPQTLQPMPNMAQSWTVSLDGKIITFRLRQDMTWSDGQPLTAVDFQWTYDQAVQPSHAYPHAEDLREISSYKALDAFTLEVVLKQTSCVGMTIADAIVPLPKHVWEKLDWNNASKNPEITRPTVVSGPFQLAEWTKNDHATFIRNPGYFHGPTLLDRYTVRIVPDEASRSEMLGKGQVDWANVSPAASVGLGKTETLQEYEWDPATATLDYIGFNLRNPILKDVQARRALSLALPRSRIVQAVWKGYARPAVSVYAPTSWVFNPDTPSYEYDPGKADATLRQAGYRLDAQGRRLDKSGRPVRFDLVFNENNGAYEQIAQIAQSEFKKLGIDVELTPLDFAALLERLRTEPFDFDLYVLGWTIPAEPYFLNQIWSSKNIPDLNPGAYSNSEIEKLYDESNRPPCDAAARKKTFDRIQTILANDAPYIYLTFRKQVAFVNQRLIPNRPSPLGIFYRPEQWYARNP